MMKLKDQVCSKRILRGGGYSAIHHWLKKHHGKANKCENPFCEKPFLPYQWAKLKNKEY